MSIKSALLALTLGVTLVGAAQAAPHTAHAPHHPSAPTAVNASAHGPHLSAPKGPTLPHAQAPHKPNQASAPVRVKVGQTLSRQQLRVAQDVDWRRAKLAAPKTGQKWLRVQGQRVLVAVKTNRVVRVA